MLHSIYTQNVMSKRVGIKHEYDDMTMIWVFYDRNTGDKTLQEWPPLKKYVPQ